MLAKNQTQYEIRGFQDRERNQTFKNNLSLNKKQVTVPS